MFAVTIGPRTTPREPDARMTTLAGVVAYVREREPREDVDALRAQLIRYGAASSPRVLVTSSVVAYAPRRRGGRWEVDVREDGDARLWEVLALARAALALTVGTVSAVRLVEWRDRVATFATVTAS